MGALIQTDPEILHGQAYVVGTRVPVTVILDCLAAEMTEDEILEEYPRLNLEGIRAAIAYIAELLREEGLPVRDRSA